jgi:hypothetical protein
MDHLELGVRAARELLLAWDAPILRAPFSSRDR